jgi:hypothetical protein
MRKFRIITFSRHILKSTTYCRVTDKEYYRVWDMDLWPKHAEKETRPKK